MYIKKRDCSIQKLNPWCPSAVEEGFCSFVFIYLFFFFVTFNSKGFNPERDAYMCTYLILYQYLAAAQKQQQQQQLATSSSVFL